MVDAGLGDVILHTPFFKNYYLQKNEKINVFTKYETHFDVLYNNPYINLYLITYIKGEKNMNINVLKTSINAKKIENEFVLENYHYGELRPSIFLKKKAYDIISNNVFKIVNNVFDLEIFLENDEILNGKKILSEYEFPICINPSSAIKIKEWSHYKWEKIIKLYPQKTFIQLGLNKEKYINGAIDFRGKYSLREQLSILYNSKIYIGLDSFWNHAAKAFNIKSVILFGPSDPKVWGYDENINIYKKTRCSPCIDWLIEECPYGKKCMNDIQILDVKKAIDQLILKDVSGFGV